MTKIKRFGVSVESELLDKFDSQIEKEGYETRSKAISDLIRKSLIDKKWKGGRGEVVGVVTMIYDHHVPNLVQKLIDVQHSFGHDIYSTMHIHLDHDNCLEILALRGRPGAIQKFADEIRAVRGVKDSQLVMTGVLE